MGRRKMTKKSGKGLVDIGIQIDRWNVVREKLQIMRHPEVAKLLLDTYFKSTGLSSDLDDSSDDEIGDTSGQCESRQENPHDPCWLLPPKREVLSKKMGKSKIKPRFEQSGKGLIDIGIQIDRWNVVREKLQIMRHPEVAKLLLDTYFKSTGLSLDLDDSSDEEIGDTSGQCESRQDNPHGQEAVGSVPVSLGTDNNIPDQILNLKVDSDSVSMFTGENMCEKTDALVVSQSKEIEKEPQNLELLQDEISEEVNYVPEKDNGFNEQNNGNVAEADDEDFKSRGEESDDLYEPSDEDLETDDDSSEGSDDAYEPGDEVYVKNKRKCQKCRKFIPKASFKKHLEVHKKKQKMECIYCGSCFENVEEFNAHVHETKPVHECQFCGNFFELYRKFSKHVKACQKTRESGTVTRSFVCHLCGKSYPSANSLKKHEKHHISGSYFCQYCLKEFEFKCAAKAHEKTHAEANIYICKHCGKVCANKISCRAHEKTHSAEAAKESQYDESFLCQICGKSYCTKSNMEIHIRYHTGERPYKCQICFKSYVGSFHLKRHMLIHQGQKLFKCNFCEKSFPRKDAYVSHMRVHTGEKPYKCRYCPEAFSHNVSCKAHEKVHSERK
ncbi:zinc finger and BTB domain-containing protein 17-like isoform X4 [Lingula anatina]|uniref:Zinc finger and BTB domain-containing protein 17-like isoform X4 n=1 Tax=Lingula anatina TaxID=7574 RepID=A0A1S3JG96_LINAN|nr:zinc finger and BTB domain-containing protein 17-like isoform X4 [Lingula anatina]|eukprot:XP_013409383.1 zinc finger and BTB domain-containing protein 17-like isoform X4 [Lingula anatina]